MLKRENDSRWATASCRLLGALGLLIVPAFLGISPSLSQTFAQGLKERKLISRVEPEYPAALKQLFIGGVVRIEVLIAPNGSVRKATLLGGSPYLGQAAMKAIKEWKYAPSVSNEIRVEKMEFDPHQ